MARTKASELDAWRARQAAAIGAGHFIHIQADDGSWRVALADEWPFGASALQAAFDAVNPDGSLDFHGDFLSLGHLPQDLGRADVFFEARSAECSAIDELWESGAGETILAGAPERWRSWSQAALPALIRAKAAHRLLEISAGKPNPDSALLALAGAIQENIEISSERSGGMDPSAQAALDELDIAAVKAKPARRAKRPATPNRNAT